MHACAASTPKPRSPCQAFGKCCKFPGRPDVLGGNQAGVAVLADDYWSAHKGQAALQVEWEDSPFENFDSHALPRVRLHGSMIPTARVVPTDEQRRRRRRVEACRARDSRLSYSMPYKAQNPLEPINVTAWAKDGGIEYWGGIAGAVDGAGGRRGDRRHSGRSRRAA